MIHLYRPAAQAELAEAIHWYASERGVDASVKFEAAVQRALNLLVLMPELGTITFSGMRCWPLKQFPYTLVYRVQGELLTVLAVAHQSREPGYWLGR